MTIPPVPQLPAQHPRAPFCQMICTGGVPVGLEDVLPPQDQTDVAPAATRTAIIPDIRDFIIFSPWEAKADLEPVRDASSLVRPLQALLTSETPLMQPLGWMINYSRVASSLQTERTSTSPIIAV